jgi:hypothetical protein
VGEPGPDGGRVPGHRRVGGVWRDDANRAPLSTNTVALETALSCPDGLSHPGHDVILLVHGTAVTAAQTWPDSLGSVLPQAGFDWCMVELPDRALGDIQTSAEYVVAAVRAIHGRSGRQVSLVSHSLGADEIRWSVRWWPDVRAEVDDLVTLEGINRDAGLPSAECIPVAVTRRHGSFALVRPSWTR